MKKQSASKEGIALVIVLGFLAILTLMAVGMAISMRTERLASQSHLDMVKARLYCSAALADSMSMLDEISVAVGGNSLFIPNFPEYYKQTGQEGYYEDHPGYVHPTDLMLFSLATSLNDPDADSFTNSLISGLGTNFMPYIPGRLWRALYENEQGVGDARVGDMAQWIHTTEDRNGTTVTNGRFMYLVFNCTAWSDVNYLDRTIAPSNHDLRVHSAYYGFIKDYSKEVAAQFLAERDEDVRYETTRDIETGNPIASSWGDEYTEENQAPFDVVPFSYFPPRRRIEIEQDRILLKDEPLLLPTDPDRWRALKSEIEDAFEKGIRYLDEYTSDYGVTAEDMYELLLDYVSDGYEPEGGNFDRPSIKPVPMLNEFVINPTGMVVEVWRPFVGPARYMGDFEIKAEIDGQSYSGIGQTPVGGEKRDLDPVLVSIPFPEEFTDSNVRVKLELEIAGGKVDEVELSGINAGEYWQCNDPRFNHLDSQWARDGTGSLGQINTNADYHDRGNGETDGDPLMYCANKPLRVLGELGYLPVAPWRTIKLYEDLRDNGSDGLDMDPDDPRWDMDPVLDYFTMQPTDRPVFGMLAPNSVMTAHRWPWAAMDSRNYYGRGRWGEHLDNSGTAPDIRFGSSVGQMTKLYGLYGVPDVASENVNMSDLGIWFYSGEQQHGSNPTWITYFKNRVGAANDWLYNELKMEHPMRRASALYHPRQSLFTVCIWAQALGEKPEGAGRHEYPILSEAQAVALVWRDPYPVSDADQRHRSFVRFMRWME